MAILGIIIAMAIIWKACDGFESATSYLGRNLSNGVRGATLNAIGSSLPELLATSLALLFYVNKEGFAFGVGTTAGSAMFNAAVIPSLVIATVLFIKLTFVVKVSKKVILRDGLSLLACELGLIYLLTSPTLNWVTGAALCSMYLVYLIILFGTMDKKDLTEKDEYEPEIKKVLFSTYRWKMNGPSAWALFIGSTAIIGAACYILVESCYSLGESLGIQTYFIAVLLAAAATSVPDTIISIKDAMKGEYDDAVANALGSNIFDICVCLGLPLLVYCLMTGDTISIGAADAGSVAELRVLLLGLTGGVFLIMMFSTGLAGYSSIAMLGLYISFVVYIVARAYEYPLAITAGEGLQSFLKLLGG